MKKTDLGVVGFMYGVCALFYYMTFDIKEAAQTYPKFIILLLFSLTTLYFLTMLVGAKKHGITSGVQEVFDGFLPVQFFGVLGMILLYLVLLYTVGFYISTAAFMVACLFFLKVPKVHILIASVFIMGLIYGAFTVFLSVKLPVGLLFS